MDIDTSHMAKFMTKSLLSVVIVVKDDVDGLERTLKSLNSILNSVQVVVVDGSTTKDCKIIVHLFLEGKQFIYRYQDPQGIYEAMNLGIRNCNGKYVMFLNAGDYLLPFVSFSFLKSQIIAEDCCLMFQSIEHYKNLWFLRPKSSSTKFHHMVSHQAVLFPEKYYRSSEFDTKLRISADGKFISDAISQVGFRKYSSPLCMFELGGVSSNYEQINFILARFPESSLFGKIKLSLKYILCKIFGLANTYRILGTIKYDKVPEIQKEICLNYLKDYGALK